MITFMLIAILVSNLLMAEWVYAAYTIAAIFVNWGLQEI